jgi:hypothetical protein
VISRSSWLAGCAAIAAAALLVGVTAVFHGPMTLRPLGVRVQMGDAMRPLALAAIADVALFACFGFPHLASWAPLRSLRRSSTAWFQNGGR